MPAEVVLQACGADLRQKALPAVCADHYIFITALHFVFLIIRPTELASRFFLLFFFIPLCPSMLPGDSNNESSCTNLLVLKAYNKKKKIANTNMMLILNLQPGL